MKVLVFSSLYPNSVWPHHGVFVKERTVQLTRRGNCEIVVVSPVPYFPTIRLGRRWHYSQVPRQELQEGIEVYHPCYFMVPKLGMTLYGLSMFLSALPLVRRLKDHFEFDIIDAHFVYPDGFAAVLLGQFFNKPVVVSARGSDINLYSTFPVISRLLRFTLLRANRVVTVSRALKDAVIRLGIPEGKIRVIPNGVDQAKFYPVGKEEARRRLSLPEGKMVLSVGNLTPNKGFDLLIMAFKRLLDSNSHDRPYLAIVGEGPFRAKLEQLISTLGLHECVRLVGDVQHEHLFLWYGAADIFCLASAQEGWPNVITESLACGTPVVATRAGGIPEIIASDKLGLLSTHDYKELASKLSMGLDREWESHFILSYAKEFSWIKTAEAVYKVLQDALKTRYSSRE